MFTKLTCKLRQHNWSPNLEHDVTIEKDGVRLTYDDVRTCLRCGKREGRGVWEGLGWLNPDGTYGGPLGARLAAAREEGIL